jgi:host factor-I protein
VAVNRKLIRTTLAEVKEREREVVTAKHAPTNNQRKRVPPEQTNAESFYYKKQMESKTQMVITLQDGEVLRGTIEWYDKTCIKLHRYGAPNLLVLKHNIKYMYKEIEVGGEDNSDSDNF